MKKFAIILLLLFYSCRDEVLVTGNFRQQYALFGIMHDDTAHQIITISKSYPVEEMNSSSIGKRFVENARVRIWQNDDVFILRDTFEVRNNSGTTDTIHYYYTDNLVLEPERNLEVEAILQNGKKLRAKSKVPKVVEFDGTNSDRVIPPPFKDELYIAWIEENESIVFSPRLIITYYKDEDGKLNSYSTKFPMKIVNNGVGTEEVYPKPGFAHEVKFQLDALKRGMQNISKGDPDKYKYYIDSATLELVVFDENLSSYYIATHFLDEFSIRLDEVDFTNIDGGFGVFGSYLKFNWNLSISSDFIKSFGYRAYK